MEKLFLINMTSLIQLKPSQIIFLIAVSILVVVGIFLIYFAIKKRVNQKKNFKDECYRTIRKIALYNDYYLLNKFIFKTEGSKTSTIDHILIGEKYFYIISSLYFDGNLSGKECDRSLFLTTKENGKNYTENPLFNTKALIEEFSFKTDIPKSFFIGIVLVNDSCQVNLILEKINNNEIPQDERIYFICNNSKLKHLIKKIESRNIKNISASKLANVVTNLDKLNRKKRNG